jgi:hypothetical protein
VSPGRLAEANQSDLVSGTIAYLISGRSRMDTGGSTAIALRTEGGVEIQQRAGRRKRENETQTGKAGRFVHMGCARCNAYWAGIR